MKNFRVKAIDLIGAALVLIVLSVYACGPGAIVVGGGGIGGSGIISYGTIILIASADVNGVVYNTDSAQVTLNGINQGVDNSGLRRGMVVRIDGTLDADPSGGVSDSVIYEQDVRGPISDVVSTNGQVTILTLLGQTVIIEQDVTVFDNGSPNGTSVLPTFTVGAEYEISGLREAGSANGAIRATYLKPETGLAEYVVKGVAENVNATSFTIAGLTVTTTAATTGSLPAAGQLVVVTGTLAPTDDLVAARIDTRADGLGELDFERAAVEGFLSNLDSPVSGQFTLNGQRVDYSAATFIGGTLADLAPGVKVEAEGPLSSGIVVADRIEFKDSIRIEGDAADSDADGSFAIDGLAGITVFVDPTLTQYDGPAAIAAGEHLRIRGRQIAGTGNIIATEIRRRDPLTRVELQAPATAFTVPPADSVTLMDSITVDTSGAGFIFTALAGLTDRQTFYGNLTTGDLVRARGDLVGGSLVNWTEIEREALD